MSASIFSGLFFLAVVSAFAAPRTRERRKSLSRGLFMMAFIQIVALIASLGFNWHPWEGVLLTLPLAALLTFLDAMFQHRRGRRPAILPGLCAGLGVVSGLVGAAFGRIRRDSLQQRGIIVSSETLVGLHSILTLLCFSGAPGEAWLIP